MDNDLLAKETWLKLNWKWLVPATVVFISIIGIIYSSNSPAALTDIVQAYNDESLCEKAIEKANSDKRILQSFGTLQPIDKLAILEGNTIYSNNNNLVELSVRIKGEKGNAKLDIIAEKLGTEWKYKRITVRNKKTKEEIIVLDQL